MNVFTRCQPAKMNIASTNTVTAIGGNDNCTALIISLNHLFQHDRNISTPRPLKFLITPSLLPYSHLSRLTEPGEISFWLNDFFALWERCHGDCSSPDPHPLRVSMCSEEPVVVLTGVSSSAASCGFTLQVHITVKQTKTAFCFFINLHTRTQSRLHQPSPFHYTRGFFLLFLNPV